MARIRHLAEFVGAADCVFRPSDRLAGEVGAVLTWGNKETGHAAKKYARRHGKPLIFLEDGFFRSVRPGTTQPPLSLVVDDRGIYYDATKPSRLEAILSSGKGLSSPDLLARAERAIDYVRRERISKYNNGSLHCELPPSVRRRVLLVDQTAGDASIRYGLVSKQAKDFMLDWALTEFPEAEIVVKAHPDVIAGRKQGFLSETHMDHERVRIHAKPTNPHLLLEAVDHVVTATSQLGFEALLWDKPVTCFGAPFYAGWGLTVDKIPVERRGARRSLAELVAAAWLLYPSYVHPIYGERCELEDVLELLALQRRRFAECEGTTLAVGFSRWKWTAVSRFFESPGGQIHFLKEAELEKHLKEKGAERVVVWGQNLTAELEQKVQRNGFSVERVEDGFLRSTRLGSDLTPPSSLVWDRSGIYYDPSRPSDLETILLEIQLSEGNLRRAARLRDMLVRGQLTKYNVQSDVPPRVRAAGRRVILVVGQVDGDASVRLGGGEIDSSAKLVRAVREACPEAFLLYKPHPDVLSGNRPGSLSRRELKLVDHVEARASSLACLSVAQEVHTLTSLLGFEALLRGARVFTYGLPFYAGWGLTTDRMTSPRRTRTLSLDELVWGALIQYPLYVSQTTGYSVGPEEIVYELSTSRQRRGPGDVTPTWARRAERVLRYLRSLIDVG